MTLAIGGIDLAILAAYFAGVVLFGLWIGRGQRNASDYLLGGRDLPWYAVLLSIVATETSTVTFLSIPALAYIGNLTFLQLALGFAIGRLVVVFVLLPQYFRGELFTAYEVLHRRFGGATKQAASVLFLITRTLADGLRLFLTAIVLEKVAGVNLPTAVVIMGATTIVYTVFGGMRSVVWNDCIQFVVYIIGAIAAGWVILARLPGGWEQLLHFAQEHDKLRVIDFAWDANSLFGIDLTKPYTFWAGLIGGAFLSLGTHGVDQLTVQRFLCARSQKEAAWALALTGPVVIAQFTLFLLLGVGLACFYQQFPPSAPFQRNDEIFASFIAHQLPVGIVGLTLAAVFSAAMSTLSSSLNSSATAAVNDLILPTAKSPWSQQKIVATSRVLTLVFGIAQIGVGILGQYLAQSVVDSVLAIAGFTTGIILGVFFLGTFTSRVGQNAALVGLLGGLAMMTYLKFGTPLATPFFEGTQFAGTWATITNLAWPWYTVVGSTLTFVMGCAASWFFASPNG